MDKPSPMRALAAILLLSLLAPRLAHAEAEPDPNIPASLAEWKDRAYATRYFLRVDAPGEAGAVGLQSDPPAATVLLPLKMIIPFGAKTEQPEDLMLVGEDNVIYPILARRQAGGTDIEVAFATRPGLRRFCLYASGADGKIAGYSPMTYQAPALTVKLRGRAIPGELAYTDANPLTLERFQAISQRGDGVLGERPQPNIDEPECPYLVLTPDQMGHVNRKENPMRYGALYEGFLRTPVAGTYKFALDTCGAAHVLINGKPLISAERPKPDRAPFALNGSVDLPEGVQRISLYYAEAVTPMDKSNADLSRFGLRLHWQPPFSNEFICIPAQAFPRALPALVTRREVLDAGAMPFIQIENVGQVRVGAHRGDEQAREFVLISARGISAPAGSKLEIASESTLMTFDNPASAFAWMPAGKEITLTLKAADNSEAVKRTLTWPTKASGARDVMDLEAELALKSAPEFLYPQETAHLHIETLLAPAPKIIPKERRENYLLPPAARPMGQFAVSWWNDSEGPAKAQRAEMNSMGAGRDKHRISLEGSDLEALAQSGQVSVHIQLSVGGVTVEETKLRLLHSRAKSWPGKLIAGAGSLLFIDKNEKAPDAKTQPASLLSQMEETIPGREHVLIMVPQENEREYRRYAPLKALSSLARSSDAIFIGDPLVEPAAGSQKDNDKLDDDDKATGIALRLANEMTMYKWSHVLLPGPHKQLPIYRMLAAVDALTSDTAAHRIPETVVLSIGTGDASRQTPLYSFERGLDVVIDRLKLAGVRRIVVVGVIPEPYREKQGEPYEEHLQDMLRQHHIDNIDVFHLWTKESDWVRRFCIDSTSDAFFGPTPNSQSLDEIVKLLKEKL